MNIIYDEDVIKTKAGKALNELIKSHGQAPLLLLLSGGSSFDLLDFVAEESFTQNNITVGMLDDRYDRDPEVNGFSKLRTTSFYLRGLRRGAVFIDSSVGEFETLETYTKRYESELKKWKKLYPTGIIRATIGVGPDGHTSGIMPYPEDPKRFDILFNGAPSFVGYDVGTKNQHRFRMTSTCTFMRQFDQSITYIVGESKRAALQKVVDEKGSLAETPGRILRELKDVTIFTDIKL